MRVLYPAFLLLVFAATARPALSAGLDKNGTRQSDCLCDTPDDTRINDGEAVAARVGILHRYDRHGRAASVKDFVVLRSAEPQGLLASVGQPRWGGDPEYDSNGIGHRVVGIAFAPPGNPASPASYVPSMKDVLHPAIWLGKRMAVLGLACGVVYAFGGLISDALTTGLNTGTALAFGALVGMPLVFGAAGFTAGALGGALVVGFRVLLDT